MTDMTLAPELPRSLQWLNAPATTLHEQRGRIVALAFVNGASAWCAQRLNDLAVLQARYLGRLQALAIHVPRFDSERDPQAALKRLRRHGNVLPSRWSGFDTDAWRALFAEAVHAEFAK